RETVVVANPDFAGRNGIILVNDRKGPVLQQGVQGVAGVQMATPRLRVLQRQQHLSHGHAVMRQRLLIGMGKAELSGGRGSLLLFQLEAPLWQTQPATSGGDRAGGDHDHFLPASDSFGQIRREAFQPFMTDIPALFLDQQCRADLDYQALRRAEQVRRGFFAAGFCLLAHPKSSTASASAASAFPISWRSAKSTARTPRPLTPEVR